MRMSLASLLPRFWRGIGWFGVALLIYLSLAPMPVEIPIEHGDKLGHALAYAVLMCWWAQLLTTPRQRVWLALGLIGLGIAIEYAQGWTGWRNFDYFDMLVNAVGVMLGWALAAPTPNLLTLAGRTGNRI